MAEKQAYYLALDPGKHTGWAMWDDEGKFLDMGTISGETELHDFLAAQSTSIEVVIVEDFHLFPNKAAAQHGSRMPAPKAIGQIETFARLWNARIVKQPANIKVIAQKMTGQVPKGSHANSHVIDAFNHGEYYLIKNKVKEIDIRL